MAFLSDAQLLKAAKLTPSPDKRKHYMRELKGNKLRRAIEECELCPLSESRSQAVPWSGPIHGPWPIAIIGEGPGYNEDMKGIPFVGRSGKLLDNTLKQVGIKRKEVFVMNTVCCRPPKNRDPNLEEVRACRPFFEQQLDISGAWLVIPMGAVATRRVLESEVNIGAVRGKPVFREGRLVLPMKHPAYYLRMGDYSELGEDMALAKKILDGYEPLSWPSELVPRSIEIEKRDFSEAISKQGWAILYSAILSDKLVVTKDETTKVPSSVSSLNYPRYSLEELLRIGMLGRARQINMTMLRAIHTIKTNVDGVVVS
jgi:DNA polymerase